MEGRRFLDVARAVVQGQTEAHWRTAAGRAYYALLLEARTALQRWGFPTPPRDRVHAFVRLQFTSAARRDVKEIGYALEDLGKLRNQADYQLGIVVGFASPQITRAAIARADAALAALDRIENDPQLRTTVIAHIRAGSP